MVLTALLPPSTVVVGEEDVALKLCHAPPDAPADAAPAAASALAFFEFRALLLLAARLGGAWSLFRVGRTFISNAPVPANDDDDANDDENDGDDDANVLFRLLSAVSPAGKSSSSSSSS